MESLAGYAATAVVMLIVGLLLRELEPKAKVVYWTPHQFLFQLTTPQVSILTHAITIQNVGRKLAEGIEIVHKNKPDFFKLQPALDYEEDTTPAGEHVIRVKSLGRREFFTIQFLSHITVPELQYIRSTAGQAQPILTQFFRVYPKWVYTLLWILILVGSGFLTYWLVRVGIFVLKGIGLLGT